MKDLIQRVQTDPALRQFVLFVLVGLLNTAFGYAVYAVLVLLGVFAHAALIIQFVAGVLWNYMTHARLVFSAKGFNRLPLYVLAYTAIYAFNAGALELMMRALVHPLLAQAILTPVSAVLAFFLAGKVLTGRFPVFEKPVS